MRPRGVSSEQKAPMRSPTDAFARKQNIANNALILILGLLVIAGAGVTHNQTSHDARKTRLAVFTHMLAQAITPDETVQVSPSVFDRETAMGRQALMERWEPMIGEASHRFNVPANWIRAVMRMESGGRTVLAGDAPITSDAGAVGIMQVEPGTYDEMRRQYGLGSDPYDPHDNVMAGAAYLRWLHGKYGFPAMFAAYNAGPGTLEDHLRKGRSLPAETRHYIAGISAMLDKSGLTKFTRPDGTPVWIDPSKVSGLRAAIPGEYDASVHAVVNIGARHQAVREDIVAATALLRAHGASV
jgi:soluble lytic murein transglycosylase-like protein